MATRFYPAAFCRDDGAVFVQFLDLPQAFTQGRTFEHALDMAREVLDLVLEELAGRGQAIPDPTPFAGADAKARELLDPDMRDGLIAVQMIPGATPGKAVRVMVSLDEELLRRVDAAGGHYGRSAFLAEAAREKLAKAVDLPIYRIGADNKMRPANAAAVEREATTFKVRKRMRVATTIRTTKHIQPDVAAGPVPRRKAAGK
ncbi:MAG: type II toxin-antitoxin system HicB family antitoxin [Rhodospirillaceae bacterium]|nr:type II toxin-antitoxin system HicB family antitoxin [Rhodospirillaceae bacterium]